MQLWTIQSLAFWEALQREKVLRTTRQHVIDLGMGEYNFPSYDWLCEQMIERIGPRPEPGIYPMWAYFQFAGAKKRRPDLRRVRSWHRRGEQHVLIELKVDEKRVLLSDYDDWHYVLNDWYFALSEAEKESFKKANHPEEVARTLKLGSWQRCLDMDIDMPEFSSPRDEKIIQATFWEIRLEDVVGVRQFEGSSNPAQFSR